MSDDAGASSLEQDDALAAAQLAAVTLLASLALAALDRLVRRWKVLRMGGWRECVHAGPELMPAR
jgi:hypothetical protein